MSILISQWNCRGKARQHLSDQSRILHKGFHSKGRQVRHPGMRVDGCIPLAWPLPPMTLRTHRRTVHPKSLCVRQTEISKGARQLRPIGGTVGQALSKNGKRQSHRTVNHLDTYAYIGSSTPKVAETSGRFFKTVLSLAMVRNRVLVFFLSCTSEVDRFR